MQERKQNHRDILNDFIWSIPLYLYTLRIKCVYCLIILWSIYSVALLKMPIGAMINEWHWKSEWPRKNRVICSSIWWHFWHKKKCRNYEYPSPCTLQKTRELLPSVRYYRIICDSRRTNHKQRKTKIWYLSWCFIYLVLDRSLSQFDKSTTTKSNNTTSVKTARKLLIIIIDRIKWRQKLQVVTINEDFLWYFQRPIW